MRQIVVLLSVLVLFTACGKNADDAGTTLAVRCGSLIDGIADAALGGRLVVIQDERITEVLPKDAAVPEGATLLDLEGYTCLPGLIDTHTHLAGNHDESSDLSLLYTRPLAETVDSAERNAKKTLAAGFTTVRNVGEYFPEAITVVREKIRAGSVPGPRIQTAGSYLTIPGGGGDLVIPGHDESEIPAAARIGVARGPEAFAEATQRILDNGADFIKVIASGAVFAYGGVPGAPEMTREEIAAVVAVARKAGVRVTAHAHGAQSIKDAILAGVDAIEHASLADDEAIALAAERGVAFSMDVYNGTFTAEVGVALGYPEEFMRKNEETTEAQRIVFEKAYKAGVPILFGTDAAVAPHGYNARQFEVMVTRGMAPMDAIRSATSVAAAHMDMSRDVGAIEAGRYGDLIAVKGDPIDDIRVLQNVEVVVKGGAVFHGPVPNDAKFADAVYHTGKIYTVDPDQPWAQAIAIKGGRITFVGSDDAVRSQIGPRTRVVDLRGRLMMPAFQDAHIHPIYSAIEVLACELNDLPDVAAYRARIAECAAAAEPEGWVTGGGWSMAAFGPGAKASKAILDEIVPDRPAYLRAQDGHTGWANSRALEIAGITARTPDPADGIIDRDADTGEAIGSLQEGAMKLVEKHIPEPSAEMRQRALAYARDMLHRYGITSVQEAMAYEADMEAYAEMDRAGQLNLRVVGALRWDNDADEAQLPALRALRDKYTSGNIRATSVKIFVDGVMENYTAVMLDPYLVESGTHGIPMIDPDTLVDVVSLLDAEGFQVHFHSLGDGAVRHALDALEIARDRNGATDGRHHLSHLQVIDPDDIPRFASLGAVANFQPVWAYNDPYVVELTLPFIKPEVAKWMYPIRSVIEAGGRVAFGSDWSVSTANPFPQIETAVTRIDANSHDTPPLNPEQAITIEQALAAFTINAAFVNHQDDVTGSIEVGKLADLIVLDKNLLTIDPQNISDTKVILTLFGGRPVYGDPAAL